MIRLLVQYFFDVGLKLVNLSTYGNLEDVFFQITLLKETLP